MTKRNQQGIGLLAILLVVLIMGVAGFAGWKVWQSKSKNSNEQQSTTKTTNVKETTKAQVAKPESATGTVVTTGESEFGPMLFNDNQQAIYIWELEETTKAECYGNCAELWPPVLTSGAPRAAGDVNGTLLGTTMRSDGSTQVTYNGHPLYYYSHEKPGEVKCHNIVTHGGLWWVIMPSGDRAD